MKFSILISTVNFHQTRLDENKFSNLHLFFWLFSSIWKNKQHTQHEVERKAKSKLNDDEEMNAIKD